MRIIQISFVIACIGSASSVLAQQKAKMCEKYASACKAEQAIRQLPKDAKVSAIDSCIVEAAKADGANGTACLKEQSGHKHQ